MENIGQRIWRIEKMASLIKEYTEANHPYPDTVVYWLLHESSFTTSCSLFYIMYIFFRIHLEAYCTWDSVFACYLG